MPKHSIFKNKKCNIFDFAENAHYKNWWPEQSHKDSSNEGISLYNRPDKSTGGFVITVTLTKHENK